MYVLVLLFKQQATKSSSSRSYSNVWQGKNKIRTTVTVSRTKKSKNNKQCCNRSNGINDSNWIQFSMNYHSTIYKLLFVLIITKKFVLVVGNYTVFGTLCKMQQPIILLNQAFKSFANKSACTFIYFAKNF